MRRIRLQKLLIIIWLISVCNLYSCADNKELFSDSTASADKGQDVSIALSGSEEKLDAGKVENESIGYDESIHIDDLPDFKGKPYVVLNGNIPDFSRDEKNSTEPFEIYSELDSLGRCGTAYANICAEIRPIEERGAIGQIKPSGWHTVKYNELIDGNYLYNRCHLIGYQLAGENANEKNLITGTRYLNVIGMLPFENMVDDYVEETGNHVLYRVTPIFDEHDLVANGVQMEAWSVEDNGKGICFNVYCYNVQPHISIDYSTGDSWIEDELVEENDTASKSAEENGQYFIANTNTKKFHIPSCASVKSLKDKNKMVYEGDVEALINQGYKPCQNCLGD